MFLCVEGPRFAYLFIHRQTLGLCLRLAAVNVAVMLLLLIPCNQDPPAGAPRAPLSCCCWGMGEGTVFLSTALWDVAGG